jgi:hypothetical protein
MNPLVLSSGRSRPADKRLPSSESDRNEAAAAREVPLPEPAGRLLAPVAVPMERDWHGMVASHRSTD